jgi:hypothetical protein
MLMGRPNESEALSAGNNEGKQGLIFIDICPRFRYIMRRISLPNRTPSGDPGRRGERAVPAGSGSSPLLSGGSGIILPAL